MIRSTVNVPATIVFRFTIDEDLTDPDGLAATVVVKDHAGTQVASGAATQIDVGVYRFRFIPTGGPAVYTVVCSGAFAGDAVSLTETVEVVSHRLFSLAELRAVETRFSDRTKYPTDMLETVRVETEDEAERIMCRSFFQRYADIVTVGDGGSKLWVDSLPLVSVSSAKARDLDITAVTIAERLGYLFRTDGGTWPTVINSIQLGIIYGESQVPTDLARAAITRARTRLTDFNSHIPDRAVSFSAAEGGTYTLATAGRAGYETGIPDVDAVYKRYSFNVAIY